MRSISLKAFLPATLFCLTLSPIQAQKFTFGSHANPEGTTFEVDNYGFIVGGRRVLPVMGEMHYSRVPKEDWLREIRKMKAGGITILSTYAFWIHHEPEEGKWDWAGNKDLHAFLQACQQEAMPVVLRIGPFCHGEVFQGGFPTWLVNKAQADPKQFKLRSEAPGFIMATQELYSQISRQTEGMLWKDGGPIVGVQIENECRGPWSYYMRLRQIAIEAGFDVPFMTRTGWPKLNGKEEFGKLLPLYGDYADGFWDRVLTDMPGDYHKAFIMKHEQVSATIATETFTQAELQASSSAVPSSSSSSSLPAQYPYLTCELGGGMMPSYHRRINISGNEAFPLAICKLGSGSNLPGYYMYHGGSNAYNPKHTMAECQASPVTNYNDMPHITYDFQAPLGEMGQPNWEAFHQTRWLHQFLADWGDQLALMPVDTLSEHYARRGCFEFRNDYVRILNEAGKASVTPQEMPLLGHTISSTSVQPFAKIGNHVYFIPVKGCQTTNLTIDGKSIQPDYDMPFRFEDIQITVLSPDRARTAYVIDGQMHYAMHGGILYPTAEGIVEESWQIDDELPSTKTTNESQNQKTAHMLKLRKTQESAAPRQVKMGSQKVAEQPQDEDFDKAAVWTFKVPNLSNKKKGEKDEDAFIEINYRGDCARVYADGMLVQDNFWNGKPMLVRASQLRGKRVELRILPMGKDYPIYLQNQQKAELEKAGSEGMLSLDGIRILRRHTYPLNESR